MQYAASPQSAFASAPMFTQQMQMKRPYFVDKRVVITGASSGVGNALAFWYLNQGAHVVLVGRDEDILKNIAQQYPSQATVVICNLLDDYECRVSFKFCNDF